ncbi:MAG: replication-associated recombination protein A [Clostridia bacterium]|nr:replication-associated recombination protein A [Clostridia bacterium]
MHAQLADLLRPKTFDDIVGQDTLFGEKGVIRRMLASGRLTNMIFYGPPGTGKTTAASIIAAQSNMAFRHLNATSATLADVKDVIAQTGNLFGADGILLYLDEIQYFNRKQQQSLLEYMEDGRITLIASTTENPHFYIYNAIISRSSLFEFKTVAPEACVKVLHRAIDYLNGLPDMAQRSASDELLLYIGQCASGDVRRAIGLLENAFYAADGVITQEHVDSFKTPIGNFDSDTHYDLLSCLQKSIRGSDPDATAFYVAKLISLGELLSLVRRLQVIASEDIGMAWPMAAVITRSCCESALDLGLPEAQIPLINCALQLAMAPKSNAANEALHRAAKDVEEGKGLNVPTHLQSPLFKGYKYPHDYPDHYVRQQYLPSDLAGSKYYQPGENKTEQAAVQYWKQIKEKKQ